MSTPAIGRAVGRAVGRLTTPPFGAAGGGVVLAAWIDTSESVTAIDGNRLAITANVITLTLPVSPAESDEIRFMDGGVGFATTNMTIARNGETIMGFAEDLIVDEDFASGRLLFIGGDWRLF